MFTDLRSFLPHSTGVGPVIIFTCRRELTSQATNIFSNNTLRSGYALSDYDRKHVLNFTYTYELPKFFSASSIKGKVANGWAISGLTMIQSGQPYSVVDYSGAVGSIFYGVNDGFTNPIVPLSGCTPQQAVTGASGVNPNAPALKASCIGLPLLAPGALNGVIPTNDPYETNFIDHGQRNISGSRGRFAPTCQS
jgi:hypothetical protein